jgi:hypothetical protein
VGTTNVSNVRREGDPDRVFDAGRACEANRYDCWTAERCAPW